MNNKTVIMKSLSEVQTLRPIKVKFLGPTTHRGARLKFFEPATWFGDKAVNVTVPFSHESSIDEQALNLLTTNGFNIVAKVDTLEELVFLCDNLGKNFIHLKTIK